MKHELPALPYALDALNPSMGDVTLQYHYGKHHQTYVNNLNDLIPNTPYANMSLVDIVMAADGPIFNNAAQVWNHTFFFTQFSTKGNSRPVGAVKGKIEAKWGSFEAFKEEFSKAALTLFGSGWAWLVVDQNGELAILKEPNAGNPLRAGAKPLMTFDVWEHAYYLDYQNRRAEYIAALWNILDWEVIESRL